MKNKEEGRQKQRDKRWEKEEDLKALKKTQREKRDS